jgi:CheY-like chemotaxis protein
VLPEISILVVDDDAVSRHVLEQALVAAGLSPSVVTGGNEALAWLEEHTPTVILLDLVMPEPDGYAVLERVRKNPKLAETPVVVLTALESDEEFRGFLRPARTTTSTSRFALPS